MKKLGRNDPCHCGSGLKYKKCCLEKDETGNVSRITSSEVPNPVKLIEKMLDWPNELHKSIAKHFLDRTSGVYDDMEIENLIVTWNRFANETQPVSKKIGVFPAALEYMLCQIYGYATSQADLAAKYGIAVGTLSQRANEIFYFLDDHLPSGDLSGQPSPVTAGPAPSVHMEREFARLHAQLEEQNFETIEQAEAFLSRIINQAPSSSKGKKPSKKEQAEELVWQAQEENSPVKRIRIAQEALLLDPNNVDAYVVLADNSASPKEMLYFYKEGMRIGEKNLGAACFEEHKGHFWAYYPTRPYMRAKKGYAEACAMMDNMAEAIKQYRELLELNPNDNQGVRELLASAYLETSEWQQAEQLLQQYEEDNGASLNYSRALTEYGSRGKSAKLTKLIRQAVAQNPFVPAYLEGSKRLPKKMPEYIGFGDDREAVAYALLNRHLWAARPELLQLLTKENKK